MLIQYLTHQRAILTPTIQKNNFWEFIIIVINKVFCLIMFIEWFFVISIIKKLS